MCRPQQGVDDGEPKSVGRFLSLRFVGAENASSTTLYEGAQSMNILVTGACDCARELAAMIKTRSTA
jgi:hypothetical protein